MNKNHLYKGALGTVLLKLLEENGRMYGYELSKKAQDLTNGDLDITEGALYPALHKLEAEGLLISDTEMAGNRIRKYYRLAPSRGDEVRSRISELEEFAGNLQKFLNLKLSHG
jgi:DNA-binding PadR family transcriptional regulator